MRKKKSNKKEFVSAELPENSLNIDKNRGNYIYPFILFIVSFILYINTIGHDYALDDVAVIHQNKFTKQGVSGIDDMLTTFYWQGYWNTNAGLYRPLSLITFAIEWQFFPGNPHISHFMNVLLYAISSVLLFLLMKKILHSYSSMIPFLGTLLFIAHPVHTEVVANIKSRDELLCFLFFIISARLLLKAVETNNRRYFILAGFTYFFCVFSKEGGLAYLGVFPLLIYFFKTISFKDALKKALVFIPSALAFLALHWYAISHAPTPKITYTYLDNALVAAPSYASRLATAIYTAGDYLKLLVIPHPLSYDYSFNQIPATTFANGQVIITLLLIGALLYMAFTTFKKRNIYGFWILFYVATIVMVSNIVTLIGATKADRFLYAPSLSFCIALVLLGSHYLKKNLLLVLTGIVLSGYAVKTITRNADWENDFTLFVKDVKAAPGSSRTHYNYGTIYMDRVAMKEQDVEKKKQLLAICIREFEEAIRIDKNAHDAYHNLGICYYHSKNYVKSIESSLSATQINPGNASTFSNLGNAYFRNGEFDKAIEALNKSIQMGFIADDTYNFLGSSYFSKKDFKTAVSYYLQALERKPGQEDVTNNLASAYASMGDFDNAILAFKKSLELNPNNPQTWYFLGLTYQNKGDQVNAQLYFTKWKELNPTR